MTPVYKTCPECGQNAVPEAPRCLRCGHMFRSLPPPEVTQYMAPQQPTQQMRYVPSEMERNGQILATAGAIGLFVQWLTNGPVAITALAAVAAMAGTIMYYFARHSRGI